MNLNLQGKNAIITGAAKNMGKAFAETLGKNGANVIVHYHNEKSKSDAEETAKTIQNNGSEARIFQADLSQVSEIKSLFDFAEKELGGIDILINNAGMVLKKPLAETSEEEFDALFGINTKAAFFCMQEAAKRIRDGGRIVNMITSLVGATTGFYSAYAGSKASLEHFTRGLSKEVGSRGITVNSVAPGPINTEFFYGQENDESVQFLKSMTPQNRLGEIEDIVPMIEFLASSDAKWVTGQTIFVNGSFVSR